MNTTQQLLFQSTRPRGARRTDLWSAFNRVQVSIHAPARGATDAVRHDSAGREVVSIHAPARGATMPWTRSRRKM